MKIIRKSNNKKNEDINIISFLEFYSCNYLPLFSEIHFEAIRESEDKRPDYYVPELKTVIEIKGIHDEELNKEWAKSIEIEKNLRSFIDRNPNLKQVKGSYILYAQPIRSFPKNNKKVEEATDQIIEAIIKKQNSITIFGNTFEITKVSNKGKEISFDTIDINWINPSERIYQNIIGIITRANDQLSFINFGKEINKKILLLTNNYIFLSKIDELIKGLSYGYEEIISYKNIDEVWFQNLQIKKDTKHLLLYTKLFLEQYENNELSTSEENTYFFQLWFSPLASLNDKHKEKLFSAMKVFLEKEKPHDLFNKKSTREEMVRLGIWLFDKKRFEDIAWLINQFIDDPDPEEPSKYQGDPKFNYHKQILENKDPKIITTVLGHLAWIIQKLAVKDNYIIQALEYTRKLLEHENLYVKLQAIIPLIEIARRRHVLIKYDEENTSDKYQEFYDTVFGLVKEYAKHKAIAKWLVRIFYYYKDLTTEEALEVLDKLKITEESSPLFIYFGIFRERHFKNADGTDEKDFNPTPLKYKLNKMITSNAKKYIDLRGNIAWNFKKILDDKPEEFDMVKPYIYLFLKQPYQNNIYNAIERIIEAWIDRRPNICIDWFEQFIDNTLIFSSKNTDEATNIWLNPEKIISFVTNYKPYKLTKIMEKLTNLWVNGAYIGSPKILFENYKSISDLKLKADVRERFKVLHKSMKDLNPKLEEVDLD
jgi:hypothetical protein